MVHVGIFQYAGWVCVCYIRMYVECFPKQLTICTILCITIIARLSVCLYVCLSVHLYVRVCRTFVSSGECCSISVAAFSTP